MHDWRTHALTVLQESTGVPNTRRGSISYRPHPHRGSWRPCYAHRALPSPSMLTHGHFSPPQLPPPVYGNAGVSRGKKIPRGSLRVQTRVRKRRPEARARRLSSKVHGYRRGWQGVRARRIMGAAGMGWDGY